MRIITGRYKGRAIKMPKLIRPTQNKVRKALFDILGDIEGLSFLDLFAGSGAIGIEALSRGAAEVVFVENSQVCAKLIEDNLLSLHYLHNKVIAQDALRAIEYLYQQAKKFDLIFLDPPYYQEHSPRLHPSTGSGLRLESMPTVKEASLSKKTLQRLGAYDILAPNGFVIIQHFKKDSLPDKLGVLSLFRQARYADTLLSFYRRI